MSILDNAGHDPKQQPPASPSPQAPASGEVERLREALAKVAKVIGLYFDSDNAETSMGQLNRDATEIFEEIGMVEEEGVYEFVDALSASQPTSDEVKLREALKLAIDHIEHMGNWITDKNAGYSFESLGEDLPGMREALSASHVPLVEGEERDLIERCAKIAESFQREEPIIQDTIGEAQHVTAKCIAKRIRALTSEGKS